MPDKLLKVMTISGREIKGTPEHPLLVKTGKDKYEMREIGKLKTGDLLVIKHTQKYLEKNKETKFIIKSEDVLEQYRLDLIKLGLLDRYFTQEQMEIMARLVGANVTDGNVHIRKETGYFHFSFCLGEIEDAYEVVDDIARLGFGTTGINRTITHLSTTHMGKMLNIKHGQL